MHSNVASNSERTADLEAQLRSLQQENGRLRKAAEGGMDPAAERRSGLLDAVLNQVAVGVIVVDQSGKWLVYNEMAAQLTGIAPDHVPMSEWSGVFGVFEADGVTAMPTEQLPLARALAGETVTGCEIVLNNPNLPQPRILSVSGRPLDDGNAGGAVVIFDDVTDRVEARRELQRSNSELQDFAHIVSHDLQEPLRTVAGFAALLKEDYGEQLNEGANEYIDYMVAGAGRMRRLIIDLLDYSRLGAKLPKMLAVDMNAVVAELTTSLEIDLAETGAVIDVADLPAVLGDEGQLTRLLQNLVCNAMKFHGPDAPRISITAKFQATSWQFSIRDNGIGIDPKHHDRIFGTFQRLHSRDEYPGTGIGLALCRRIVVGHGGQLTVESQLGRGATFLFELPHAPRPGASA